MTLQLNLSKSPFHPNRSKLISAVHARDPDSRGRQRKQLLWGDRIRYSREERSRSQEDRALHSRHLHFPSEGKAQSWVASHFSRQINLLSVKQKHLDHTYLAEHTGNSRSHSCTKTFGQPRGQLPPKFTFPSGGWRRESKRSGRRLDKAAPSGATTFTVMSQEAPAA